MAVKPQQLITVLRAMGKVSLSMWCFLSHVLGILLFFSHLGIRVMLKSPPEVLVPTRELVQFYYFKAGEGLLTPVASYFS